MNFRESESYLLSLGNEVETMKLGLANIRILLDTLGNPHNKYLKVQVAGTNGKGSVCAFLDAICLEAGILTGLFTSPHLVSITERIRIGGQDVSEEEFARLATLVRESSESLVGNGRLETVPTYFEQVTAMALTAFANAKVNLAILETGLGGRFDATTAANAEIAAITQIDLDHQEFLGETMQEIAAEKAAIIRPGSRVVAAHQSKAAERVIEGHCREVGVEPVWCGNQTVIKSDKELEPVLFGSFRTERENYSDLEFWEMRGRHQFQNASVAIAVSELLQDEGFTISKDNICTGIEHAKHPGRLEHDGRFLYDGAHNIAGARALRDYLDEFVSQPITIVFGAMKDKDIGEIARLLFPKADTLILTKPDNSRSLDPEAIEKFLPEEQDRERVFITHTVEDALEKAIEIDEPEKLILITGSLYLIGEAKKIFNNKKRV